MLLLKLIKRELLFNVRQSKLILNACLFYAMILVFFPLFLPANAEYLRLIAPGIFWMALLLSLLLSSERLFQQDYDEGILEQWITTGIPLYWLVTIKLLIQWGIIICLILLSTTVLSVFYHLQFPEIMLLNCSLLCGSLGLYYLCALVATFGLGLKQKGVLMALILMPLTIPILIFGSGTTQMIMQDLPFQGNLAILVAISLIILAFLPIAIAGAIRLCMSE